MKRTRIVSFLLCLVLILGLVPALPSFVGHKVNAALTNFAPLATYKGGSNTITNGTGSYGEDNWTAYHTGKLNDGTIDTAYTATGGNNVEISITGYVGGTIYVYFKLPYEIYVSEVDMYANIRDGNATRDYPTSVNVYVGNSETVSSCTKMDTTTNYAYNTSVKNYVTQGRIKGNTVILEFTTTNAACFMALTEVQIWGMVAPSDNIASGSQYKASDNCIDNNDGTWGEANWNTYHFGRLNDGIIDDSNTPSASSLTDRYNVEFWANTYDNPLPGTVYIYFALPSIRTISTVNVYANLRANNASRGYPASVNVYVGRSESDVSASTKLGTATYSAYNSAVRKYTTNGSLIGSYVILEITTADPTIVAALTEVEIIQTKTNTASTAQYKGSGVANGTANTDTFGEANWTSYHTGRLNDGIIAPTYTPRGSSTDKTNVEMYLDGFVAGNVYVYFKLAERSEITQVNVYANKRASNASRGYPTAVNVYVADSETDISSATKLGDSSYTAYNSGVRNYATHGSKSGSYVIVELGVDANECVVALTEVEISTAEATTGTKTLASPELKSSTKAATFTVPTFTWAAVENATSYDVYLNDTKVVSDTTGLSYTPTGLAPFNLYGKNDNRSAETVYVVAKAADFESSTSNTFSFRYVDKPTDRNGNPLDTADFVLDAGHGGTDPGAMHTSGREEADDNLNMTLAAGKFLEDAGFTVAYTRITDVFDSPSTKAAKGEAGNFSYYISFHRNSATTDAYGVEYLYQSGDTKDEAFATAFNNEFTADAIWTNRGNKARTDLTILNNTTMPMVMLELGFISTDEENTKFDTFFNETAQAIARAAIKHAGYSVGYSGTLESPAEASVSGTAAQLSVNIDKLTTTNISLSGWILHTYGVKSVEYSVDNGSWVVSESHEKMCGLSER